MKLWGRNLFPPSKLLDLAIKRRSSSGRSTNSCSVCVCLLNKLFSLDLLKEAEFRELSPQFWGFPQFGVSVPKSPDENSQNPRDDRGLKGPVPEHVGPNSPFERGEAKRLTSIPTGLEFRTSTGVDHTKIRIRSMRFFRTRFYWARLDR